MDEELEMRERRRQHLALIEFQIDLLHRQFELYRAAEESVERKGPQPAGPTSLALVKRAG